LQKCETKIVARYVQTMETVWKVTDSVIWGGLGMTVDMMGSGERRGLGISGFSSDYTV
jgi:hypothetical protein